ncbi:MAG TPA: hydroxymethylbilane synthase [Solirubrobacteraceae bacterium]|nr:hydroxymethylbilane synthase [Solirubrobacteraceae bacterium]
MIRIGTRSSALALAQANAVGSWLAPLDAHEIVVITTAGDRGEVGDKARWTSELERALLAREIDVAVHSAKDVPGQLAEGTTVAAVPGRAGVLDAICGFAEVASIPPAARVGTSSIRRTAQLRALRDDLTFVTVRGNVDTRLRKLAAGEVDALVLAQAGLERLGREREIGGYLDELVPAPGQGALLVQARADDAATLAKLATINDETAERCVMAERALASSLKATCNTPLGALGVPASGMDVMLRAWVGLPDGSHWIADELTGQFDEVGGHLAERMIAAGARELLQQAEELAAR